MTDDIIMGLLVIGFVICAAMFFVCLLEGKDP